MKIKILILLCCATMLFSACSNHYYAPALYHQDIAYMPKPASFDTAKTVNYLSGGINTYTDQTWADLLLSGQVNYSRGHVFNHANLAYGVFGVAGSYESGNGGIGPNKFYDKFFGAAGARLSGNLFTSFNRADFRYLGFEMAYSHEFGTYSDYRQYIQTQPGYHVDTRNDLVTLGLTSEIIFHDRNNPDIEHGLRGFIGGTFGPDQFTKYEYASEVVTPFPFHLFPKASYFVKVKHFFGVLEIGSAIFVRAGYNF